jgi:hypothetical protein
MACGFDAGGFFAFSGLQCATDAERSADKGGTSRHAGTYRDEMAENEA